jgi:hypothetical protein
MLPGMGGGMFAGQSAAPEASGMTVAYTNANVTVNNDTWTLGGVTYGAEPTGGATRHLVVLATAHDPDTDGTGTGASITATLGGNAVTWVKAFFGNDGASNAVMGYIGIIEMPTGTTGTLVVNASVYSGVLNTWSAAILRVIGLSSATPSDTDVASGSMPLTVPANGFGALVAVDASGTGETSISGTGVTTAFSGSAGRGATRTNAGTITHSVDSFALIAGASWSFA